MARASTVLIKGGRIFDGEKFFYADVLTEGDRIVKLEQGITDGAAFVYDASGKTVLPGLVDAHVHMRGISSEEFGIHAEMSAIPFGVTAAADASGKQGDRALLESFLIKGVVFAAVEIKNNHAVFTKTEDTLRRFCDKAVGIKVYFDTSNPELFDITPLRESCELARELGLSVMVHCTGSPSPIGEILEVLGKGDILTHAFHGGKNNAREDGFLSMIRAKERGVIIDAGLAGFVHTDFGIYGDAIRRGVLPDVISTDITRLSAYKRGGRYGLTTCMSISRHLGMREEDIFRCVTSDPARALCKSDEWGRLEVGRCADIAVLDYTNEGFDMTNNDGYRIKSDTGYRCVLTVIDGEVVYRD